MPTDRPIDGVDQSDVLFGRMSVGPASRAQPSGDLDGSHETMRRLKPKVTGCFGRAVHTAPVEEMLLSTATELMLRQCCAPAFNRVTPSSTSPNGIQLDSKLSAGLARNHLDSLGLLGLVSIFES